jgi:hypothetical protein
VQLNAAGRHTATQAGWHVMDVEPIIARFAHPKEYLLDAIHQQMFLSVEIMNVYLNMIIRNSRNPRTGSAKLTVHSHKERASLPAFKHTI